MSENTDITSLNGKKITVKLLPGPFCYIGFYHGKKLVAQMRADGLFDGNGNFFDISALGSGL